MSAVWSEWEMSGASNEGMPSASTGVVIILSVVGERIAHTLPARRIATKWGPLDHGALAARDRMHNVGAILYGLRWPNPWPHTFGYHEFFHAFTAAAAASHYVTVWFVVP